MGTLTLTIPDNGNASFFDSAFLMTLEHHIPRLKAHQNANMLQIEPTEAIQFQGDLSGLLSSKGIPGCYHYAIMRCNDMLSLTELSTEHLGLIIPPFDEIDQLQQIWTSNNNLNY